MLLLGIDIGTSSIKVSVVDSSSRRTLASAQYPDTEAPIISLKPGWAEQSPLSWWEALTIAIGRANASGAYDPKDIAAIGIAYQMHGLVLVDKDGQVLRNSIIWCDSRAVPYGDAAFDAIGHEHCLSHLLNSPGNFTAAKLAWVKEHEPAIYEKIDKMLLPGDYIALRLTGEATTSVSALSEGIFWDFQRDELSEDVFRYFGFDKSVIPSIQPVFAPHGGLKTDVAASLGLREGIPVTYKAGDQPNNALSLNVLEPGEVAATAGTSGVIYGVSDKLAYDPASRVNSFAHVNYTVGKAGAEAAGGSQEAGTSGRRIGVLLCINGTGILNRWVRDLSGGQLNYTELNALAAGIAPGSEGLMVFPFGNGAERMLENRLPGAQMSRIDLNLHHKGHLYRAGQEGIAFAFRYGLDIMRSNGMAPSVIRAGRTNMFLSSVFAGAFVNTTGVPVELYDCDGSVGAALGAGIGAGIYASGKAAFADRKPLEYIEPTQAKVYDGLYAEWKAGLERQLQGL